MHSSDSYHDAAKEVEDYMLSLFLTPLRIIQEKRPSRHLVSSHSHKYIHLICLAKGSLLVSCNNVWQRLQKNDLLLICPGTQHIIYTDTGAESYEMKFECTDGMLELKSILESQAFWLWRNAESALPILTEIMEEAKAEEPYSLEVIGSKIYLLLMLLLRSDKGKSMHKYIHSTETFAATSDNELINDVLAYIDSNLTEPLTVSSLADAFGYTRNYLSSVFKNVVHITPQKYIMLKRIDYSKKLIRQGSMSHTEIAELLQFGSVQAFSTTFKKCCGITPKGFSTQNACCTYINLTDSPLLPPNNVRDVELRPCEDFRQQFKSNDENDTTKSQDSNIVVNLIR